MRNISHTSHNYFFLTPTIQNNLTLCVRMCFFSTGEFGIVYKGHLSKDFGLRVTNVVAVKTLKGMYNWLIENQFQGRIARQFGG